MADIEFTDIKIDGLAELETALKELPEDVAQKIFKSATRKAFNVVQKQVIANAPRGTTVLPHPFRKGSGYEARDIRLYQGIKMNVGVRGLGAAGGEVTARIGLTKSKKYRGRSIVFYGRFLEFGAPGRNIAPRKFMRSAFDSRAVEAVNVFKEEILKGIEKIAALKLKTKLP